MSGPARRRSLLLVATGVCAIGAIDAALGEAWDLLALFSVAGLLLVVSLVLHRPHRHPVELRGDLVRWLRQRAAVSGESVETLADRAVAAYRADLTRTP